MVRSDHEQRVEAVSMGLHRRDDLRHQPVRDLERMKMLRRAQRIVVQCEIGVGEPENGQPETVRGNDLVAEAPRHLDVAVEIVGNVEMGVTRERDATGAERAGAMQDRPEMIGIEEIGRAGRDVRIGDLPARARQPLRHRRHPQGAPGHAAHGLPEGRCADIVDDDAPVLDQRHLVAFQAMAAREAAGRDRGG